MSAPQRVKAVDDKMQALRTLITFSAAPLINEPFRTAFNKMFTTQWVHFRDGAATLLGGWSSGLYEPRFQDLIKAHDRWTQEYNRRRLAGEPEHAYIGDTVKVENTPIADTVNEAVDDATEPFRGAITGFGAGVMACALIAIVVAWKR